MQGVRDSDRRTVALLDGFAAFWVVFWLVVGALTAHAIWSLSTVSDTAEISAEAVDRAGRGLQRLSELPLISDEPGALGAQIRDAAAEMVNGAGRTREAVHRLSVLLGLTIFLVPTAPVWVLYVPSRHQRRREVAALGARLRADGDGDPALQAYLAQRAVATIPFDQLVRVTADPAGDVASGRHGALAKAELVRLGLPAGPGPEPGHRPDLDQR